jgi:ribosome-associated toxin RatA of RatAB toxin-antitoxin module
MPAVEVRLTMGVPAAAAWRAVTAVEDYPGFMDSVREVRIQEELPDGTRLTHWSVLLKGSVLEWTERETVHEESRRLEFEQVEGDLDLFRGAWSVTETSDGCTVRLEVDFDIGIPLLAEMLNPVAARALHENSAQMLQAIERRAAA